MGNRARFILILVMALVIAGLVVWKSGKAPDVVETEKEKPASTPAALPPARFVVRPTATPEPASPPKIDSLATPQPRPDAKRTDDASPPRTVPGPAGDIATELEEVHTAIRDFRAALGSNPVGTNAEITKALLGDNLKQIKLPVPAGSSVNGNGELCDRWGTPYFFHQVSADKMEIRSAGPDRTMWTPDDRQ